LEGYFREPDITRGHERPLFHTGDMAVWDEEGFIHIVDRKKEIIYQRAAEHFIARSGKKRSLPTRMFSNAPCGCAG